MRKANCLFLSFFFCLGVMATPIDLVNLVSDKGLNIHYQIDKTKLNANIAHANEAKALTRAKLGAVFNSGVTNFFSDGGSSNNVFYGGGLLAEYPFLNYRAAYLRDAAHSMSEVAKMNFLLSQQKYYQSLIEAYLQCVSSSTLIQMAKFNFKQTSK